MSSITYDSKFKENLYYISAINALYKQEHVIIMQDYIVLVKDFKRCTYDTMFIEYGDEAISWIVEIVKKEDYKKDKECTPIYRTIYYKKNPSLLYQTENPSVEDISKFIFKPEKKISNKKYLTGSTFNLVAVYGAAVPGEYFAMEMPPFASSDPSKEIQEEVLRKSKEVLSEFQNTILSYNSDKKVSK